MITSLIAPIALLSTARADLPADEAGPATVSTWSKSERIVPDLPADLFFDVDGGPVPQIVNGDTVPIEEFRDVVHLSTTGDDGSGGNCTGTLIHPEWVLTASHCTDSATPPSEGGGGRVRVSFGNDANNPSQGVFQAVDADFWEENPQWLGTDTAIATSNFTGDVALIHLETPVVGVQPTSLNQDVIDSSWLELPIQFVGFGITRRGASDSGVKRTVVAPVFGYTDWEMQTFDGVHSTCQGDSGGPGFLKVGGGAVQVSVTSYGSSETCEGAPSSHQRVDAYLDWIRTTILPATITTTASAPPTFQCNREVNPEDPQTFALGTVPMELRCVLDYYAPDEIQKVTWEWGDGGSDVVDSAPFTRVSHVYETTGSHTVRMCVEGEREAGPWQHCIKRYGYVRSCGVPAPSFDVERDDGLAIQTINNSDVSDYGCISDITWQVFKGADTSGEPLREVAAWQPQFTFDEPGEYTAVLNLGGIGGTGAAKLTFDVTRGSGCDTAGLGSVGALTGLLAVAGVVARRRRRA